MSHIKSSSSGIREPQTRSSLLLLARMFTWSNNDRPAQADGANPYFASFTPESTDQRSGWFREALFAAYAAFGLSHCVVLIATSILFHGRFVPFPANDSAHLGIGVISSIIALLLFTSNWTRRFTNAPWIAPGTFAALTLSLAGVFYVVGPLGRGHGMIDLTPYVSGCLVALIPLNFWLSFVRFSKRRLIVATTPILIVLLTMAYASMKP